MPVSQIITPGLVPEVHHVVLDTTFRGIEHPLSAADVPIHQYRGIKYASVPARFRQSKLVTKYPPLVDAAKYGYVFRYYHVYATYLTSSAAQYVLR